MIKNIHITKHFKKRYIERRIYKITKMSLRKLIKQVVRIENLVACNSLSDNNEIVNIYRLGRIVILTNQFNDACITVYPLDDRRLIKSNKPLTQKY